MVRVVAEARDANGDLVPGAVIEWSRDPDWVAGVSATGNVVAWNVGSATVTARVGDAVGTMHLEVVRLPVDSISIWPEATSLVPGATVNFDVRILDSAGGTAAQHRCDPASPPSPRSDRTPSA